MSFIKNITKDYQKLINLQSTRLIMEQDLILPEWKFLNNELKEIKDSTSIDKAIWCIINSIFYQKRICFTLTRDALRDMIKNDKNLSFGLKNENYAKIIFKLTNGNIIKCIAKGDKAYAYEVTSPELLAMLVVDVNTQRKQAIDFASGIKQEEIQDFAWEDSSSEAIEYDYNDPNLLEDL